MDRRLSVAKLFGALPLLWISASVVHAQTLEPIGDEFQVNSYTTGAQTQAAVSATDDGAFAVAWETEEGYGLPTPNVLLRFYDSNGAPGGTLVASDTGANANQNPAIGSTADGDFVVVWNAERVASSEIQGRLFFSDGSTSSFFTANQSTTVDLLPPSVAMGPGGEFVVVWGEQDSAADPSGYDIFGRRFDSTGNALGNGFQINTYTTNDQSMPRVGTDASGNFLVVWESDGWVASDVPHILAQRYDSTGGLIGDEFEIQSRAFSPDLDVAPSGRFVVVLNQNGYFPGTTLLAGSVRAADGTLEDTFQVDVGSGDTTQNARVAFGNDGGFVVTWDEYNLLGGTDDSGRLVGARHFDGSMEPVGSMAFQVNTYTTDVQQRPSVAADGQGHFIIAWDSFGSSGTDNANASGLESIQAQRLANYFFTDGFESGDLSSWVAVN